MQWQLPNKPPSQFPPATRSPMRRKRHKIQRTSLTVLGRLVRRSVPCLHLVWIHQPSPKSLLVRSMQFRRTSTRSFRISQMLCHSAEPRIAQRVRRAIATGRHTSSWHRLFVQISGSFSHAGIYRCCQRTSSLGKPPVLQCQGVFLVAHKFDRPLSLVFLCMQPCEPTTLAHIESGANVPWKLKLKRVRSRDRDYLDFVEDGPFFLDLVQSYKQRHCDELPCKQLTFEPLGLDTLEVSRTHFPYYSRLSHRGRNKT